MRDSIIRAAFHESILKNAHQDIDTVVIDELGIKNGAVRADIAVLNGKMIGYEIKSEKDTLVRLSSQAIAYSEVFEKSYIIVADKHIAKIGNYIPDTWGIYSIDSESANNIIFHCKREATQSETRNINSIVRLLWKSEVSEILTQEFQSKIKSSHTKNHLYNMLVENCDINQLSNIVLKYLKQRQDWRINRKQLL
jgi:hypothetical protein